MSGMSKAEIASMNSAVRHGQEFIDVYTARGGAVYRELDIFEWIYQAASGQIEWAHLIIMIEQAYGKSIELESAREAFSSQIHQNADAPAVFNKIDQIGQIDQCNYGPW
mgnify:CR=1 FL=1